MIANEKLLAEVNAVIEPLSCKATDIGPESVGVQGDARVYKPVVFVTFPIEMTMDEIGKISTMVTNQISGVSRVLMNVMPT
mgnify:CR=1 FL=1